MPGNSFSNRTDFDFKQVLPRLKIRSRQWNISLFPNSCLTVIFSLHKNARDRMPEGLFGSSHSLRKDKTYSRLSSVHQPIDTPRKARLLRWKRSMSAFLPTSLRCPSSQMKFRPFRQVSQTLGFTCRGLGYAKIERGLVYNAGTGFLGAFPCRGAACV